MVIRLLHHKLVEQRIADLRSTAVRSMPAKRSERTIYLEHSMESAPNQICLFIRKIR